MFVGCSDLPRERKHLFGKFPEQGRLRGVGEHQHNIDVSRSQLDQVTGVRDVRQLRHFHKVFLWRTAARIEQKDKLNGRKAGKTSLCKHHSSVSRDCNLCCKFAHQEVGTTLVGRMLPKNCVTVTDLYGNMNESSRCYLEVVALLEAPSSVCGCSFGFGFLGLLSAGSLKIHHRQKIHQCGRTLQQSLRSWQWPNMT